MGHPVGWRLGEKQKQIPYGNDKQKGKGKSNGKGKSKGESDGRGGCCAGRVGVRV